MNDSLESQECSLDVVRIYRGTLRGWATHEFGKSFLLAEVGGGFECDIPNPPSSLCFGAAWLGRRKTGRPKAQFWTSGPPPDARGYAKILQGPAIRIRLKESVDLQIDWSAKARRRQTMLPSMVRAIRPRVRNAFLALNHFFDVYRVTRFERHPDLTETADGKGPWAWMDPSRPETFSEFLHGSYASLRSGQNELVTRLHEPKMFSIGIPEIFDLQETLRQRMDDPLDGVRLTMLDAWTALYEGNIPSAIVLANTAIEMKMRHLLISRLPPGTDAERNIDKVLANTRFFDQLDTLLPLAGLRVHLPDGVRQHCQNLRHQRTGILHRREALTTRWDTARRLLHSAERAIQAITKAGESDP